MIDQGIFSQVIILIILITYLLTVYGYCYEKIDLRHYWDLKGLIRTLLNADNGHFFLAQSTDSHGKSTSLMQTLDYQLCAVIDLSFLKVKRPSVDSTVDVTSATVHRTQKHRIQRIALVLPLFIYRVT